MGRALCGAEPPKMLTGGSGVPVPGGSRDGSVPTAPGPLFAHRSALLRPSNIFPPAYGDSRGGWEAAVSPKCPAPCQDGGGREKLAHRFFGSASRFSPWRDCSFLSKKKKKIFWSGWGRSPSSHPQLLNSSPQWHLPGCCTPPAPLTNGFQHRDGPGPVTHLAGAGCDSRVLQTG